MAHGQDRTDSGHRANDPRAPLSQVTRVDLIHEADLERILEGEAEPGVMPEVD